MTNPQSPKPNHDRAAEKIRQMQRFAWTPLILILIAFVILSIIYAWATPPLEASDELWHMGMVIYLADNGALPVQDAANPDEVTIYEQEGSQPPLYYMLAAGIAQLFDRSDFDAARQPNPHVLAGIPGAVGNKNLVLHPTPSNTALMVYALRAFSILLGCVTICVVYMSARLLVPDRPIVAFLAVGLTAFNPMFLFITASVNNDNLVTALNSLIIWQMLVMLRDGFLTRRSIFLTVLLALASLSKLSAFVLMPVVGLAALIVAFRYKNWRGLIVLGVLVVGAWLLLAGWWYLRNITLYGELFGTRAMVAIAGAREVPFTFDTMLSEFQGFRFSYWALFGAVNVMTFRWFYDVMDVVILAPVIGLAVVMVRRWTDREFRLRAFLLSLIIVIGFGAFLSWTAQTYASQGRLLFPFVAAISPLFALGFAFCFEAIGAFKWLKYSVFPQYIFVAVLGVFALIVPFASIAPQYTPPAPLDALPASARPVYANFGHVELIGYETPDDRYERGSDVPITVYWRVIEQSERDLSLWLHAVNDAGETLGTVDSYPGAGRLRTTTWQAGAIYADSYAIPLTGSMAGGSRLRVQVGWWHYPSQDNIGAVDENSQVLESVMLDAGGFVGGWQFPTNIRDVDPVNFGEVISLTGYQLEGDQLTLLWEPLSTPAEDYTVFVQVLDDENNIVGQGDAPPELPTHYWQGRDSYITSHTIIYPQPPAPGTYRVFVGWYAPDNFARLNADYPDNAYPLTTIEIP